MTQELISPNSFNIRDNFSSHSALYNLQS